MSESRSSESQPQSQHEEHENAVDTPIGAGFYKYETLTAPGQYAYNLASDKFERFLAWISQDKTKFEEVFPSKPTSVVELINSPDGPLNFQQLVTLLLYHAEGSTPRSRTTKTINLKSLHTIFTQWKAFILLKGGSSASIDPEVSRQITRYINHTLKGEMDLLVQKNEEYVIGWEEFKKLQSGYLHPSIRFHSFRIRFQALVYSNILLLATLRAASLLQGSKDNLWQHNITWNQLRVVVSRVNRSSNERNELLIIGDIPNGKTPAARGRKLKLKRGERGLWADPVFTILILAHISDAMPVGWTFAKLLDPESFDGHEASTMELEFNPEKGNEPLFLSTYLTSQQGGTPQPADSSVLRNTMRQASNSAGLYPTVTPLVIRHSAAQMAKQSGSRSWEIASDLAHKKGGTNWKRYTERRKISDSTSAFYGLEHQVESINSVHPDRIKSILKPLPESERYELVQREEMINALDELRQMRTQTLKDHGCVKITQLPDAEQKTLKHKYDWIKRGFNSEAMIIRQRIAKEMTGYEIDSGELEGVSLEDDFPDADDVELDADAAVMYLQQSEMGDPISSIFKAYEEGHIDAEQFDQALENLDNIDCVTMLLAGGSTIVDHEEEEDFDEKEEDFDEKEEGLNHEETGSAVEKENDIGQSSTSKHNDTLTQDPISASKVSSSVLTEDELWGIDMSPLAEVADKLFSGKQEDELKVFDFVIERAVEELYLFGYRPGQAPINGLCHFCQIPLKDVLKIPARTTGSYPVHNREAANAHVLACGAQSTLEEHLPGLLTKYSQFVPINHITGKTIQQSRAKKEDGTRFGVNDQYPVYFLSHSVKKQLEYARKQDYPPIQCVTCNDGVDLKSTDQIRYHLLTVHDVWLPRPLHKVEQPHTATAVGWTQSSIFPLPPYFTHDHHFHPEPKEAETFAAKVIKERIHDKVAVTADYGIRTDIRIPVNLLNGNRNGLPSDNKYTVVTGRGSVILRDELCICCANDPSLPNIQKVFPIFRDKNSIVDMDQIRSHRVICIRNRLAGLMAIDRKLAAVGEISEHWEDYIYTSNGIICPDPLCSQKNICFQTKLEWLQHLVGVHNFHFQGKTTENSMLIPTLQQLTFGSETELEEWVIETFPGLAVTDAGVKAGKGRKLKFAHADGEGTRKKRKKDEKKETSGSKQSLGSTSKGKAKGKGKAKEKVETDEE